MYNVLNKVHCCLLLPMVAKELPSKKDLVHCQKELLDLPFFHPAEKSLSRFQKCLNEQYILLEEKELMT